MIAAFVRLAFGFSILVGAAAGQVVIDCSSIFGPARISDVEVAPDGSIRVCAIRGSGRFLNGQRGGFVAKLSPDGADVLGVKVFPDAPPEVGGETWPWRMAVAADGGMIVVGQSSVDEFEVVGPLGGQHQGRGDAFIAKLDENVTLEWSTLLGGVEPDDALDVEFDSAGRIIVVGTTTSPDFPTSRQPGRLAREAGLAFPPVRIGLLHDTRQRAIDCWRRC